LLQFKNYPVYANFNIFSEAERAKALQQRRNDFYSSREGVDYQRDLVTAKYKYGAVNDYAPDMLQYQTDTIDRQLEEIQPDPGTTNAWERAVLEHLSKIVSTQIGNLLFSSLRKTVKVWIVADQSPEGVAATTTPGPLSAQAGGGVRLYFDPDGFPKDAERFTAADILFHEMVHAYRSGWKGIKYSNWRKMNEYQTAEEFLAIHLQNIFMGQIGKNKFYISHKDNRVASVNEVYQHIAERRETMEVLHYYLYNEPFASIAASWREPKCNVWRDYNLIRSLSPFRDSLPARVTS